MHDTSVYGIDVGPETRCAHYASDRDVIAIKFACCETYYPCVECHDELVNHQRTVWPRDEFDKRAILCGCCGEELSIHEYLDGDSACPACGATFNERCAHHWPRYFDVEERG